MARITVQMGHVARRTGATGTYREQEAATAIGTRLATRLRERGHVVRLIGADDSVGSADLFVALHTDGSSSRSRRGCSVGYPDANGRAAGRAWKEAHQRIYSGGSLPDNYTTNLSGYYGFRKARGTRYRYLAEHCFTTNPDDCAWLFANLDAVADAHVHAIGQLLGHPSSPPAADEPPPPIVYTEVNVSALPVLHQGHTGHHVRVLQSCLNLTGVTDQLATDGDFGPATAEELRHWQDAHVRQWKPTEFDPHGTCGPHTWSALLGLVRN